MLIMDRKKKQIYIEMNKIANEKDSKEPQSETDFCRVFSF
jgi:hypothetical protein